MDIGASDRSRSLKAGRSDDSTRPPPTQRGTNNGAVTITLHTAKEDCDEKAQVKVQLANPDALVERMLETLAHKFPPESVMTIAAGSSQRTTHRTLSSSSGGLSSSLGNSGSHLGDPNNNSSKKDHSTSKNNQNRKQQQILVSHSAPWCLGLDGNRYEIPCDSQGPLIGYVRGPDGSIHVAGPPAYFDATGKPVPGFVIGPDGNVVPGIPVRTEDQSSPGTPTTTSNGSPTASTNNRAAVSSSTLIQADQMASHRVVKIPAPSYLLADGTQALLAVGPDGRPLDGHCQDPITGNIVRVGRQFLDSEGKPVDGFIQDEDGKPFPGKALAREGLYDGVLPLPHYYSADGRWLPMLVDGQHQLMHGYCRDPNTGVVRPVGLQVVDPNTCRPVAGQIIGPDGRQCSGIALSTLEVEPGYGEESNNNLHQQQQQQPSSPRGQSSGHQFDPRGQSTGQQFDPRTSSAGAPYSTQQSVGYDGEVLHPSQSVPMSPASPSKIIPSNGVVNILPDGRRETVVTQWDEEGEIRVRYVEVPIIHEEVRHIRKPEVRHVEQRVPKVEVVEVEKLVEVPEVRVVERQVPVDRVEEVVREIPVKQIVEKPVEVVVTKPVIHTQYVEKVVEVPGEVIEVPVVERIQRPIPVPVYQDRERPTVIAQKLQPRITLGEQAKKVDCVVTEPKIIKVDVFVPKPVASSLVPSPTGPFETHKVVDIPAAQFNSLARHLNPNLDPVHLSSLLVREGAGVPILPVGERVDTVEPLNQDWQSTHQPGQVRCTAPEKPTIHLEAPRMTHKSRGGRSFDDDDYSSEEYQRYHRRKQSSPKRHKGRRRRSVISTTDESRSDYDSGRHYYDSSIESNNRHRREHREHREHRDHRDHHRQPRHRRHNARA